MNKVQITKIESVETKSGNTIYRIVVRQQKSTAGNIARRLSSIFNNNKGIPAFISVDENFLINEVQTGIMEETGEIVDIMSYVDMGELDEPITLPESLKAQIVVMEFTEGEQIPEQYVDDVFVQEQNRTVNNQFKVATWINKAGEPQSTQPKVLRDENGEITQRFTHNGKPIYRLTALWLDGDNIEARADKLLAYDKEESATTNATSALKAKVSSRKVVQEEA